MFRFKGSWIWTLNKCWSTEKQKISPGNEPKCNPNTSRSQGYSDRKFMVLAQQCVSKRACTSIHPHPIRKTVIWIYTSFYAIEDVRNMIRGQSTCVLISLLSFSIYFHSLDFCVPSTERTVSHWKLWHRPGHTRIVHFYCTKSQNVETEKKKKWPSTPKKTHSIIEKKMKMKKKMGLNFIWCDVFPMWRIFCAGSLLAFDICSPQVSSGRSILDSITFSHHSLAVRLWSSCVFVSFYALWACYKKIQHKTNEEIACFFFAFKY